MCLQKMGQKVYTVCKHDVGVLPTYLPKVIVIWGVCIPKLLGVVLLYFQTLLDKLCVAFKKVHPPLGVFVQIVKLVLKME